MIDRFGILPGIQQPYNEFLSPSDRGSPGNRFMMSEADSRGAAGVLLHPTSLPGPYGIGDLGPSAYAWVDALVQAKQTWWQILPLGPTGYGDSPYQCFSAFAGNPRLISPDSMREDGLIDAGDLHAWSFPAD